MALTEQVNLDIQSAQRQIDALERQLDQLSTPINVPVNVSGGGEIEGIRRDFDRTDDAVERLNRELDETERGLRSAGTQADRTTQGVLRLGTRGASVFTNLRGSVLGLVTAFGAIQGARALFDFFGDSIEAASNLEESTSKATVVFGEFFDEIQAFASTAPQAMGLANQQALEFTATFGNLFTALGLSQSAAADLAPEIVQLGADLASFNNLEVTEALDKLRAGLVGEAEPLRSLGVNLTAAATAAKAVELGLAASTGEVSEAAKVQARYALILEQTATAQGDFARTSDSIANRQRTLAAEFQGTREAVGEALLPAFELLLEIAPQITQLIEDGLVPAIASLSAAIGSVDADGFARTLAGLPSAIGTAFSQLGAGVQALGNLGQAFGGLATLNPDQFFRGLGQALDDFNSIADSRTANRAVQDLLTTIEGGAKPLVALESVLASMGDEISDLDASNLEDLANQLVVLATAAGAGPLELFDLATNIREMGEAAGLSAPAIEILVNALQAPSIAFSGEVFGPVTTGITGIGDAAGEATPPVEGLGGALQAVADTTVSDALAAITEEFGKLPGAVESARTALQTEEDETVEDASGFISDLQAELRKIEDFSADINIARALGLDDTAALAAELGPDFARVLSQAIDDPSTAAQLESTIEAFAEAEARFTNQALTTALLDEFSDAVQIPLDIDFQLRNIRFNGAGNLFENINLGPLPTPSGPTSGGPNGGGGGVTINNTFEGFVPSTPDLVRANQANNQVSQY